MTNRIKKILNTPNSKEADYYVDKYNVVREEINPSFSLRTGLIRDENGEIVKEPDYELNNNETTLKEDIIDLYKQNKFVKLLSFFLAYLIFVGAFNLFNSKENSQPNNVDTIQATEKKVVSEKNDVEYAVINDSDGYTNLREKPTTKSKVIRKILEDEKFQIIEKKNDWWLIKELKNGKKGFIHKSRIKIIKSK